MTKSSFKGANDAKLCGRKKIAIIGTGLAGLHAAHLLSETEELRERYDVHLFEKGDQLGLDANSITVEGNRIDVPLRSFNSGYYPNLMRLYKKLNISIRPNNFNFSFSSDLQDLSPFLLYNGHSGLKGISLPDCIRKSAYTLQSGLTYVRLIILVIFSYLCLLVLSLFHYYFGHLHDPAHHLSHENLQSWLERHPLLFSSIFIDAVLYPLFSAMTTSSLEQVQQIPTSEVLLYIATTFMRSHYTIRRGVSEIQDRLVEKIPAENFHMSTSVNMVKFGDYNGEVKSTQSSTFRRPIRQQGKLQLIAFHSRTQEQNVYNGFQHVIFATPASRSAIILNDTIADLTSNQNDNPYIKSLQDIKRELQEVQYENSTVINHTDETLMPASRKDWRDLNLVTSTKVFMTGKTKVKRESTMATHACHRLKNGQYAFQTTNTLIPPNPASILSMSTFPRALSTPKHKIEGLFCWRHTSTSDSRLVNRLLPHWQLRLGDLQSHSSTNLFFCGSYSQGIPLLEGCITSSALVVSEILDQDSLL